MDATNNDVVNAEHEQKSQAQPQLRQKDEKYELVAYPPINIQQFSTLNPNIHKKKDSTLKYIIYSVLQSFVEVSILFLFTGVKCVQFLLYFHFNIYK